MTPDQIYELLAPAMAAHVETSESTLFIVADLDGGVRFANRGACDFLGIDADLIADRSLWDLIVDADIDRLRPMISEGVDGVEARSINFTCSNGSCETFNCQLWTPDGHIAIIGERSDSESLTLRQRLLETHNELIVNSRELARRSRELEHARRKLQSAFDELETSYWHLKKIQEVLPICMDCGKVKASEAGWEDVVDYLQENALFLSHGYCPDFAQKMMAEYGLEDEADAEGSV